MNDETDNDAEYDYDNCDIEDYIMDGYRCDYVKCQDTVHTVGI